MDTASEPPGAPSRRRALVTGASSGIGAATATALAAGGCDVWLTYARDERGAAEAADEVRRHGAEARVSRLDLGDAGAIERLLDEVSAAWGELHVLVNNGGVCPYTPAEEISVEEWDAVLETNARGTFLALRGALPLLRAAPGDRSVVNVSSVAGELGGVATSVHYAASKAAILAITRSYARLLAAEGIRVNAVAPGVTETQMLTDAVAAGQVDAPAYLGRVPMRRWGRPEEIGQVALFLASDQSSFVTGQVIAPDGGWSAFGWIPWSGDPEAAAL